MIAEGKKEQLKSFEQVKLSLTLNIPSFLHTQFFSCESVIKAMQSLPQLLSPDVDQCELKELMSHDELLTGIKTRKKTYDLVESTVSNYPARVTLLHHIRITVRREFMLGHIQE